MIEEKLVLVLPSTVKYLYEQGINYRQLECQVTYILSLCNSVLPQFFMHMFPNTSKSAFKQCYGPIVLAGYQPFSRSISTCNVPAKFQSSLLDMGCVPVTSFLLLHSGCWLVVQSITFYVTAVISTIAESDKLITPSHKQQSYWSDLGEGWASQSYRWSRECLYDNQVCLCQHLFFDPDKPT